MFDQILDLVKDQLGNNQTVENQIPGEKKEQVHREVATQIDQGIKQQAATDGIGGLLSKLAGGGALTDAIKGGLVGALGSKLGLPAAATGAIAAALPGLLQKFANKVNDPNDDSITPDSITKSVGGRLGSFF